MANPAKVADIVSRWRPLSAQETTNATALLEDAWVMLARRLTQHGVDIDAEIADDANLSRDVVRVLSSAVIRVLKNPDGKRQESIDDYSWTRDNAVSAGVLYFTDAELNDLAPGAGGTGGAFSVNLLAGWSPE